MTEHKPPRDYLYIVQAWLPNTLYEPQEFGMDNREAAISAARAIAEDGAFYRTTVLAMATMTEEAHFLSEVWRRAAARP